MTEYIKNDNKGLTLGLFDFKGYNTRLDIYDMAGETFANWAALKIPIYKKDKTDYTWQIIVIDSLMRYLAKKGVKNLIQMAIPKTLLDYVMGLPYISDGILNVIVGVLARKGLTYFTLSSIDFESWMTEVIHEIKLELIKQGINMTYDVALGK